MRLVVIASITRNNGKAVMNGSRGDNQVWLGESMARLPPFLDQKAPLEHDVFGDLENPMVEHRSHLVREPVIQLGAAVWFVNKLDAKADLGESYRADVKLIKRAPSRQNLRLSVPALGGAVLTRHWYREATPSECNTSNREAGAGWFKIDFSIWRGLHGSYQVGTGVRGGVAG
jgi:hypothetical protein